MKDDLDQILRASKDVVLFWNTASIYTWQDIFGLNVIDRNNVAAMYCLQEILLKILSSSCCEFSWILYLTN